MRLEHYENCLGPLSLNAVVAFLPWFAVSWDLLNQHLPGRAFSLLPLIFV